MTEPEIRNQRAHKVSRRVELFRDRERQRNDLEDPERNHHRADCNRYSWHGRARIIVARDQQDHSQTKNGGGQLDGEDRPGLDGPEGEGCQ